MSSNRVGGFPASMAAMVVAQEVVAQEVVARV